MECMKYVLPPCLVVEEPTTRFAPRSAPCLLSISHHTLAPSSRSEYIICPWCMNELIDPMPCHELRVLFQSFRVLEQLLPLICSPPPPAQTQPAACPRTVHGHPSRSSPGKHSLCEFYSVPPREYTNRVRSLLEYIVGGYMQPSTFIQPIFSKGSMCKCKCKYTCR